MRFVKFLARRDRGERRFIDAGARQNRNLRLGAARERGKSLDVVDAAHLERLALAHHHANRNRHLVDDRADEIERGCQPLSGEIADDLEAACASVGGRLRVQQSRQ